MKIVFVGGGTGGHFYPLIAVAEAVRTESAERDILTPQLYYIAPEPYDAEALFANSITFIKSPAGKIRRYASIQNITGLFTTIAGVFWSLRTLYKLYPDVIFSKGGYASVPTVIAAHFLKIPIIIHESDAKPGRANLLASKYAYRIAVAFEGVKNLFPLKAQDKVAVTGIPVREAFLNTLKIPPALTYKTSQDAKAALGLNVNIPTVLILGGSSGSQRINDLLLSVLPDFVAFGNIIHQTGKNNFKDVQTASSVILDKNANANRYHPYMYLGPDTMVLAAQAADVIISRAGSTSITEISLWKKPAVLIPIPEAISHDQRTNAYSYAHTGAAIVLEEKNMTPHLLVSEARRIASDPYLAQEMGEKGASFANPKAASLIGHELLEVCLAHEADSEARNVKGKTSST